MPQMRMFVGRCDPFAGCDVSGGRVGVFPAERGASEGDVSASAGDEATLGRHRRAVLLLPSQGVPPERLGALLPAGPGPHLTARSVAGVGWNRTRGGGNSVWRVESDPG